MKPLEIVADVLIVVGVGLGVAACALVSTALALGVAALSCLTAGAILTALAIKQPRPPRQDHGPFEPGS